MGAGRSLLFDDRIRGGGDAATLSTGTGSRLRFRRGRPCQHFTRRGGEPVARRSSDITSADTASGGGLRRTCQKTCATYRLTQFDDPNGNAVDITFNPPGSAASPTGGPATIAELSDRLADNRSIILFLASDAFIM